MTGVVVGGPAPADRAAAALPHLACGAVTVAVLRRPLP